jgi:hypothetical membrane protein
MEKLNKIYEKIHASYFAIIGVIIFMIGLIPAILVHPDFSFLSTFISNLGEPSSNDLWIYFNVLWFITGILMIFFIFGFTQYLQQKGAHKLGTLILCIFGVLSAVGILGLAIFNAEDAYKMHYISELLFFFTGILYLFGYATLEHKLSDFPKWQVIFNIIVAFFFILYLILLIVNRINEDVAVEPRTLAEWLFLFANLTWFVENGVFILKIK